MTLKKYPQLHNENWWSENKDRSNVDIANELGCSHSNVHASRKKMGIKQLSCSETTRRQWNSLEFRKKTAKYPILYDEEFWKDNKHKTNSEISNEIGCSPVIVGNIRKFMGYNSLSRSESQKRRYRRDGVLEDRNEIPQKIRDKVLERAEDRCEVPGCDVERKLQVHHFKRNSDDLNHLIVLCYSHHIWIEKTKMVIDNYNEAKEILARMFPEV